MPPSKKRKASTASPKKKELDERPDPPPPAPASLVRLLQKDAAVCGYFEALQANLDYDVQKWKKRARGYEQQVITLQRELEQLKRHRESKNGARHQRDDGNEASDKEPASASKRKALKTTPAANNTSGNKTAAERRVGNDDDFELEFSSSSEDEEEDQQAEAVSGEASGLQQSSSFGIHKLDDRLHSASSQDDDDDENESIASPLARSTVKESTPTTGSHRMTKSKCLSPDVQLAVDQLMLVQEILKELGIALVEAQEVEDEAIDTSNPPPEQESTTPLPEDESVPPSAGGDSTPRKRHIFRRRSDQDVAIDLFQFLKALTRIKYVPECKADHDAPAYCFPFWMTNGDYIPCYMSTMDGARTREHPAVAGVEKLLTCLCYMDVFCPALDGVTAEQAPKYDRAIVAFTDEENPAGENDAKLQADEKSLQYLLLGMRGRESFVSNLIESLEGEIVDSWTTQDRATRLVTKAMHYSSSGLRKVDMDEVSDAGEEDDYLIGGQASSHGTIIPFGSKSFVRLAALMERCLLAKVVATVYMFRHDYDRAYRFVWAYVLATAPSLALEDHPRLPPVHSFCVLEAILLSNVPPSPTGAQAESPRLLDSMAKDIIAKSQSFGRTLQLVWECTADLYRVRSQPHLDDRMTDLSKVELASYERLQKHWNRKHWKWLPDTETSTDSSTALMEELDRFLASDDSSREGSRDEQRTAATTFALVVHGDARRVDETFQVSLAKLQTGSFDPDLASTVQEKLRACVTAKAQLELRQLEVYRRVVKTPMIFAPNKTGIKTLQSYSEEWVEWLTQQDTEMVSSMIALALRSCQTCSDAERAFRLVDWTMSQLQDKVEPTSSFFEMMHSIEAMAHAVTVRVINLERRPDRLAAFLSQAVGERLLVLKGVVTLNQDTDSGELGGYFGAFAFDGQGKAAEVERRLVQLVGGGQADLNAVVQTHWVPNELKPFDNEAPDSDKSVLISPSEKACALSHLACWRGVERSLSKFESPESTLGALFRNPGETRQRFLISGYACGPNLFPSNDGMGPTPVCVILEDDAILVDRFSERLSCLLEELPRDFHFCSLGYSRPKTAPLVPFSSQLAIPTSIWYLTGYILSLEGARYLKNKLPVRGPVDSWIGQLIFTNNWDNVFGNALGVGVSSKPLQDPSIGREDLRRILRFRAFAASAPLCSQRVGSLGGLPSSSRNWRQRDTDIVYSGS